MLITLAVVDLFSRESSHWVPESLPSPQIP